MSLVGPRPQTKRCFDVFPSRFQKKIIQLRPGLSGIGAIIFCDEENLLSQNLNPINFYDQVVAPYKGEVESWYVAHQNLHNYFLIIFLTVWVVISPPSNIVWRFFPDLPIPPNKLKKVLNYKTV
jgi:lipopolysaccharide/colanic/teichoic acid biosynthesis glycosyltransferase